MDFTNLPILNFSEKEKKFINGFLAGIAVVACFSILVYINSSTSTKPKALSKYEIHSTHGSRFWHGDPEKEMDLEVELYLDGGVDRLKTTMKYSTESMDESVKTFHEEFVECWNANKLYVSNLSAVSPNPESAIPPYVVQQHKIFVRESKSNMESDYKDYANRIIDQQIRKHVKTYCKENPEKAVDDDLKDFLQLKLNELEEKHLIHIQVIDVEIVPQNR